MKLTVTLAVALACLLTYSEAIFFLGTGTAAAGTAAISATTAGQAVALAGVGGLVLGAGLIGVVALAAAHRRGRGKRSLKDNMKEQAMFNLVSSADTFGCAMKLVCLLEAKPEEELGDDDKFILTVFGREPEAPAVDQIHTARGVYDYAAFMGSKFGSDSCEQLFFSCDYTYEDMIAYVANLRA